MQAAAKLDVHGSARGVASVQHQVGGSGDAARAAAGAGRFGPARSLVGMQVGQTPQKCALATKRPECVIPCRLRGGLCVLHERVRGPSTGPRQTRSGFIVAQHEAGLRMQLLPPAPRLDPQNQVGADKICARATGHPIQCAPAHQRLGSLTSPLESDVPSKITAPHSSIQTLTDSPKNSTP